jgi:hypothetical protein
MSFETGNLGNNERLVSVGAGTLLSAVALRSGGPIIRLLAGVGALAFLARAFAGHCGMKSALTGQSSLGEGMSQQWRHMTSSMKELGGRAESSAAAMSAGAEKSMREQGPSAAQRTGAEGSDWMSHQNGRVTGTGVTPGTGDSEAGTSAPTSSAPT